MEGAWICFSVGIVWGLDGGMMLKLQLYGPLSITDEMGVDRRPKLMKARAILAVLAATKGHRHSPVSYTHLTLPTKA